jgi:hypothetical protein
MIEKFAPNQADGTKVVMVGLGPTIQPSASSGACGALDPRDKPEDDTGGEEVRRTSESGH